ncbi:unnamed protein product [Phaeothamnion confervicola]
MGDAPFVPAGWDTPALIEALLPAGRAPWKDDTPFEMVVGGPPPAASGTAPAAGGKSGGGAGVGGSGETLELEQRWLAELDARVQADSSAMAKGARSPPVMAGAVAPAGAASAVPAAGAATGAGPVGAAGVKPAAGAAGAKEASPGDLTSFFQGLLNSGGGSAAKK